MLAKNIDNYKVMLRVSRVGREERLNQDGEMEQAGARLAVAVNIFVCGRLSFAIDIFSRFNLCYCGGRVCQMFQIDTIKKGRMKKTPVLVKYLHAALGRVTQGISKGTNESAPLRNIII